VCNQLGVRLHDCKNHTIWVVDGDADTRAHLSGLLTARGFSAVGLDSGTEALCRLACVPPPSALLLDIRLPDVDGLEVLAELAKNGRRVPTIVLSDVEEVATVVKAIRLGALDYLVKPLDEHELETVILSVIDEEEQTGARNGSAAGPGFATSNPRLLQVQTICDQVAPADVPVLIMGESGVGKEVLARSIHARSGRPEPFAKVNCAALPADLLESELFGHERGAFTGAQREKPGKFELAGQGTIMLDEIAEMSTMLQAKLLHVLQDGEYARLGATRTLQSGARIIAATNKNLQDLVARGGFREDLYFRLNVITVEVPPLRERREDVPALCRYFVDKYKAKYRSTVDELPPELVAAFTQYSWPGNVRQLENAVKRFLILPSVEQALAELARTAPALDPPRQSPAPAPPLSLRELSASAAEQAEKELILRTLNEVNWNRKHAAKRLNICYKSLLNKLHRWQLRSQVDAGRHHVTDPAIMTASATRAGV